MKNEERAVRIEKVAAAIALIAAATLCWTEAFSTVFRLNERVDRLEARALEAEREASSLRRSMAFFLTDTRSGAIYDGRFAIVTSSSPALAQWVETKGESK